MKRHNKKEDDDIDELLDNYSLWDDADQFLNQNNLAYQKKIPKDDKFDIYAVTTSNLVKI